MKRILTFAILLVVIVLSVHATDTPKEKTTVATTSIVGKVVDEATGEPLAGVSITIEGTKFIAYTDFEGEFKINEVIPGEYTIKSSMISYKNGTSKVKAELKDHNTLAVKLERSK